MKTQNEYITLQQAFDHFNKVLFDGKLPQVLITLQRKGRSYGYFAPDRFLSRSETKSTTHELALNPDGFRKRSDRDIFGTLVHEQVHLWQQENGSAPSNGYHNKEWAAKMKEVGLYPSSTGEEGGRETGQKMSHYIVEGGSFDVACGALTAKGLKLTWESIKTTKQAKKKTASKTKFSCPDCDANAWGKPTLNIECADCGVPMLPLEA